MWLCLELPRLKNIFLSSLSHESHSTPYFAKVPVRPDWQNHHFIHLQGAFCDFQRTGTELQFSGQWGWAQKDPSHRFATGPRKRSCAFFRPFGFPCRQGGSRLLPAQPHWPGMVHYFSSGAVPRGACEASRNRGPREKKFSSGKAEPQFHCIQEMYAGIRR